MNIPQNPAEIDPKLRHGPEARHTTVGELRAFLEPFADDTPLKPMCYGAFRYAIDGECNGQIQMA